MNANRSEHGQAIVLIILAIVVMFGFVGLAVDGGRVFAEKRQAQNAADAAAYAAAIAAIDDEDARTAAMEQAALNDYETSGTTIVNFYHPPIEGPYAGDDEYYQVVVERNLGATFGRAIGMTEYAVKSVAVAHAQPVEPVIDEDVVIHALDDDGVGIEFKGGITVKVSGGSIYSNSGITRKGASGDIKVEDGGIYYTLPWEYIETGIVAGQVSPRPEPVSAPLFPAALSEPDCGTTTYSPSASSKQTVYEPGIYTTELVINSKDVKLNPGMYCLMDGMRLNGNVSVIGTKVMFVLLGGNFLTNAATDVYLTRPSDLVDPSGNQWGGMLLYAPPSNPTAEIELGGNANLVYAGTVFAPLGWCRVGGNAEAMSVKSNIICENILFHGNPLVNLSYKQPQNYQMPPMIELTE